MPPISQILVPVDLSESSRVALRYAGELAKKFGAAIDVLHVWEAPPFVPPGAMVGPATDGKTLVDTVREGAEQSLSTFVEDAKKQGVDIRSSRCELGVPTHAIIDAGKDGKYDLIVMGTLGRSGLSHVLLGSTAERVVRHAPCPVLTVRTPLHRS
jgi:nucleotide-binding universal stress UspA family protein